MRRIFSEMIPYVLHRVEFRAVRRQIDETDVLGLDKRFRSVPSGIVNEHDDEIIPEVFGYMLQKQVHHFRVRIGQNQGGHLAQSHTNDAVHVYECPDDLPWDFGTHAFGRPTVGGAAIDSSESTLILG